MARFDGRPTRYDWTHVKGTDSKIVATFVDASDVAVDLSGRTITAVAYAPGSTATAFALTTAVSGVGSNVLTVTVPDDATLPTERKADGTLDWALTIDFATGQILSVVAGSFWIVNPGSPESYSTSSAVAVTVSTGDVVSVAVSSLVLDAGLPVGGLTGQSLVKSSNADYDMGWLTPAGGGDLLASANLGDLDSASTSRTNIGLGTGDTPDLAITNMTLSDASLVVLSGITNAQSFADGVDDALLKARGTGVSSSYVSTVAVGGTTFAQPAVVGEIRSDEGYFNVSYTGATGITVGNLTAESTYVYIDSANALQQQTTIPTRQDWSRKIFTMRISVDTSTNLIIGFEYLNNPLGNYANSTRDLYTYLVAQGVPFKAGQTITGRAGDLGFDVSAGTLLEYGGTGDIDNPNIKSTDAVANATYALLSRTALVSAGNTDLVKFWDNAGTITALGSTTLVGHRLYRFSNGAFALQYGQGNYANMDLAKAGVLTEEYVLNTRLENATFFGWWFIESTATNTGGTTLTDFVEYTIGVQGGSSAELSGALLKGNNLSDVLDAGTALTNIGAAPVAEGIQTFATVAARDAAIVSPTEGMHAFTSDTDTQWLYSGSAWLIHSRQLTEYTPTISSVTVGNGTIDAWYSISQGVAHFSASFTLGSTSAVSSVPSFSLPVTAAAGGLAFADAHGMFRDSGTSTNPAIHEPSGSTTTTGLFYASRADSAYVGAVAVSSTVPHTWATNDIVSVAGSYRIA
jgi:hypothetical protein